jgi:hypothetical protein
MEIRSAELRFNRMEIVDEAGEKSEERLLLESRPLLLMQVGKNENKDGQNLRQIVHLGLIVVVTRGISVILDDVDDQPRHGIQCLERIVVIASINVSDVAVDT